MPLKHNYTYKDAHNRAVNTYQRCVIVILFIGLLNVAGAITGSFKAEAVAQYFPSLISNILLFRLISYLKLNIILEIIINVAISIAFACGFATLWFFAKKGKRIPLYVSIGYYLLDTILIFIFFGHEPTLVVQIVLHIIVLMFLIFGIVSYHQIFAIEKKYHH